MILGSLLARGGIIGRDLEIRIGELVFRGPIKKIIRQPTAHGHQLVFHLLWEAVFVPLPGAVQSTEWSDARSPRFHVAWEHAEITTTSEDCFTFPLVGEDNRATILPQRSNLDPKDVKGLVLPSEATSIRHNVYEGGRVQSLGFRSPDHSGQEATIGIAAEGNYNFGRAKRRETIRVLDGQILARGVTYDADSDPLTFEAGQEIDFAVLTDVAVYLCYYG